MLLSSSSPPFLVVSWPERPDSLLLRAGKFLEAAEHCCKAAEELRELESEDELKLR